MYKATGSQTTYSVSFPYLNKEHVHVYLDGALVAYEWLNAQAIRLTAVTPTAGAKVLIKRITPISYRLVDYATGAILIEQDLDTADTQLLYLIQEVQDALTELLLEGSTITKDDLDKKEDKINKGIKNGYCPLDSNRLVPKEHLPEITGSGGGVEKGVIGLWTDPVDKIPTGWSLCDGKNGTPNLEMLADQQNAIILSPEWSNIYIKDIIDDKSANIIYHRRWVDMCYSEELDCYLSVNYQGYNYYSAMVMAGDETWIKSADIASRIGARTWITPLVACCYAKGLKTFFIGTNDGTVVASKDPTKWDKIGVLATEGEIVFLEWFDELGALYAIGKDAQGLMNQLSISTDGETWKRIKLPVETRTLAYSKQLNKLCTVGLTGVAAWSYDKGDTWVLGGQIASNANKTFWSLDRSDEKNIFVVVSQGSSSVGSIQYSKDGETWFWCIQTQEGADILTEKNWRKVQYIKELSVFLLIAYDGTRRLFASSNAKKWVEVQQPVATESNSRICYFEGFYWNSKKHKLLLYTMFVDQSSTTTKNYQFHASDILEGGIHYIMKTDGSSGGSGSGGSGSSSGGNIPQKGVIMWNGYADEVPTGWALCDGTNGTPDLVDRFVMGAKDAGATGGNNTLTLTANNLPKHSHASSDHEHSINLTTGENTTIFKRKTGDIGMKVGTYFHPMANEEVLVATKGVQTDSTEYKPHTYTDFKHTHPVTGKAQSASASGDDKGEGTPFDVRPEYYALAFIMKL